MVFCVKCAVRLSFDPLALEPLIPLTWACGVIPAIVGAAEPSPAEIVDPTARIEPHWMNLLTWVIRVVGPAQESRLFAGAVYSLVHSFTFSEGESRAK